MTDLFKFTCPHIVLHVLAIKESKWKFTPLYASSGDQEVTGLILAGSSNMLSWRLIMKYFHVILFLLLIQPALMAQLDAPSDWRPGGRGFNLHRGQQHFFMEIDHEIFSTVILSLPLIQKGQLSVFGKRMCTTVVIKLETRRSRVQPPPRSATFFHGD